MKKRKFSRRTMRMPLGGRKFVHYFMDNTGKVHECFHNWWEGRKKPKAGEVCVVLCEKYNIKFIGEP